MHSDDPLDGIQLPRWRDQVQRTAGWGGVLLCDPAYFEVVDEKNTFMAGQIGRIDRRLARQQWQGLEDTYRRLDVAVHILPGEQDLEDMVFCANGVTVLPRVDGGADVVPSHMNHPSRQAEVQVVTRWLAQRGLDVVELPSDCGHLEGHGDVAVIPGRRLALGGYGGRSELSALQALSRCCDHPVVPLAMVGSPFYHLDTCLAVLDEDTVLVHPPAFRGDALETLGVLFPRVIEADPEEAELHLAVNVHALASGAVLHPAQATRTARRLADAGYEAVPVDVSEFHTGGSVFCMRLDVPGLPLPPRQA